MWRQNRTSNVNPTDVLTVETLIDEMADLLTSIRRGRRSLRRTWSTTQAGLPSMVRACSLLNQVTVECWDLLSSMETHAGAGGTEQPKTHLRACTTSQATSPVTEEPPCVDVCRYWATQRETACFGCDYSPEVVIEPEE